MTISWAVYWVRDSKPIIDEHAELPIVLYSLQGYRLVSYLLAFDRGRLQPSLSRILFMIYLSKPARFILHCQPVSIDSVSRSAIFLTFRYLLPMGVKLLIISLLICHNSENSLYFAKVFEVLCRTLDDILRENCRFHHQR